MAIKDIDFRIALGNKTEKIIQTPKIVAELDALIISSSKPCYIQIGFLEIPEIIIFEDREFNGNNYLPIRIQATTPNNKLLLSPSTNVLAGGSLTSNRFLVNNKLFISVSGSMDTTVNLTMRVVE